MAFLENRGVSQWRIPVSDAKKTTFPSPFLDVASLYMPYNIKEMFKWAEHLYLANGIVSQCIERIVKYPLTNIIYDEESTEVQQKYTEFFEKTTDFRQHIVNCGIEFFVYGNCFSSIYLPFTRHLKCNKCHTQAPVTKIKDVSFEGFKYKGTCVCGNRGTMEIIDRRSLNEEATNYIRWNPHYIDISYNQITGKYEYYYTIPPDIKKRVNSGDLHLINGMPWNFIQAIKDNKMIKFAQDSIYHMRQPSLSGLNIDWGIPPSLRTFKLHYFAAVLRRANEAIAQDYLVPIRVFFPQGGAGVNDPTVQVNLNQYKKFLENMVKHHRSDPADAYFSPIPVGYQALGGEAKALRVSDDIQTANEEIMAALGFPKELFYGTMSVQSAPMALRLFENSFSYYISTLNRYLAWTAKKVGTYFDWDPVTPKFAPVTLVDDIERKQILLQLAGSQMIAKDTLLSALGTDVKKEIEKQMEEQRIMQQVQKEFQEKQEVDSQQEGGTTGTSLTDMNSQADQTAQTWLQMPDGQRKSEMAQMARANPTLYAIAKDRMEKMRGQLKSQAFYQQQQQGVM